MLYTPHRSGGHLNNIMPFYNAVFDSGRKVRVFSIGNYGTILEPIKVYGKDKVISCFRPNDTNALNIPNYNNTPANASLQYWTNLQNHIPPEFDKSTYLVILNEIDKNRIEWLADFASDLWSKYLNPNGYKALFFNFSGGEPEKNHWRGPKILSFLRLCENSNFRCGVGLHEYSNIHSGSDGTMTGPVPWLIGRYQWLKEVCVENNIDFKKIPVGITEFGYGQEHTSMQPDDTILFNEFLSVHNDIYAKDSNILMLSIWAAHISGPPFFGEKLSPRIDEFLKRATANLSRFEDVDKTAPPPPDSGYPLLVALIPENFTDTQINWINNKAKLGFTKTELGTTVNLRLGIWGWSHRDIFDVARRQINHPNTRIVILDGHQIGTGLDRVWMEQNEPLLVNKTLWFKSAISTRVILDVPFTSQLQADATLSNDCGTASTSMLIQYVTSIYKSPDFLSNQVGKTDGRFLSINELIESLRLNNVSSEYKANLSFDSVKNYINNKKPLIALLQYGYLPQRVRYVNTNVWHFMPIVGYTDNSLIFNDPLNINKTKTEITWNEFLVASKGDGTNAPYQYIATVGKITPPPVTNNNAKNGIHLSASGGDLSAAEITLVKSKSFNSLKVLTSTSPQSIAQLGHIKHWIIRPFLDFGGRVITPNQFYTDTINDLKRTINALPAGSEYIIEIHNEPNLSTEGLGASWKNGIEFSSWFISVVNLYKQHLGTGLKIMYPGLSPGGPVSGLRYDEIVFYNESVQALSISDSIGLHCYWSNPNYPMTTLNQNLRNGYGWVNWGDVNLGAKYNKKVYITEYSNNGNLSTNPAKTKAEEYKVFLQYCRTRTYIAGIYSFVASAHPNTFIYESWLATGIGDYYV